MKNKWSTVAPIHWLNPEMFPDSRIPFSNGVIISPVSNWMSEYKMAIDDFPEDLQDTFFKGTSFFFLKEYKADSLNEQQPQALELIRVVNLVLWVIKPSKIAFDQFIHLYWTSNTWNIVQSGTVKPLIAHEKDKDIDFNLTNEDIKLAQNLHKNLVTLKLESPLSDCYFYIVEWPNGRAVRNSLSSNVDCFRSYLWS